MCDRYTATKNRGYKSQSGTVELGRLSWESRIGRTYAFQQVSLSFAGARKRRGMCHASFEKTSCQG